MGTNVVVAGVGSEDEFVELAARPGLKPKGKLYRKQILHWGDFQHPNLPGKKITVDEKFADALITNFSNGVCDIVQVPIVDDKNKHTEDPTRNVGQVVDIERDAKGVYAVIDARKEEYAKELGKTLIGASAMMNLNYTDTRTGKQVGPTLLHTAITNRPYITNLDDFEEMVSMSADTSDETVLLGAVNDAEENESMTKDELIAALKKDHDIDVTALLAVSDDKKELAALSNVLGTDGELTINDVAEAVLELSAKNDEQTTLIETLVAEKDALRLSNAEAEIDGLVSEGRVLPKQRDAMVKLSMNDRETFESLLPEASIVSLSESGVTTHTDSRSEKVQSDLDRYYEMIGAPKTTDSN